MSGGDGRIRAVICDFGGVLTTPLYESFVAYQRRSGVSPEQMGEAMRRASASTGSHPLHELERGEISEATFLARLEAELDDGTSLHEFRDAFFDALHPNDSMIELMRSLRARGYRTALLTNNVREWEPRWRGMLPELDEIFELVVDSAFVGMRKPEHGIYELTLERIGDVRAEQCVFVDDVGGNCDAARELGIRAIQFLDTEQAIGELEAALEASA